MGKFIDLSGETFGRLTVKHRAQDIILPSGSKKTMWRCICSCGVTKDVWSHSLISGTTTSCGCKQREVVTARNTTHGLCKNRIYRIWCAMKTRCYNPSFFEYAEYGGRGITICDEWFNDFEAFYNWAICNGYDKNLSIDRINVDEGYSPENCRWATRSEQNNNRRNCVELTFRGEKHTMAEWARIVGIPYQTLKDRIRRYGWSTEKALTTGVKTIQITDSIH